MTIVATSRTGPIPNKAHAELNTAQFRNDIFVRDRCGDISQGTACTDKACRRSEIRERGGARTAAASVQTGYQQGDDLSFRAAYHPESRYTLLQHFMKTTHLDRGIHEADTL